MTPRKMIGEYAAWHLGDPGWGEEFYDLIEALRARAGQ